MEIGCKIKELRLKNGLTQEELGDRCELTKGYISQLENDLTSPSIATLKDILTSLGTNLADFFADDDDESLVYGENDYFVKENADSRITWLVPTAQKNEMEPIRLELKPGAETEHDMPHEGEEFGYVLKGKIRVHVGKRVADAVAGESFYYRAAKTHYVENVGKGEAVMIWLSCPPNF